MRIRFFLLTGCFLFTFYSGLKSQVNCTVPLPPVFTSVSVRPETGITDFSWNPSPSTDIAAYLVYEYYNENGVPRGDIIDTIWDPSATSYSFASASYKYHSTSYVIAAYRLPGIPGMDGCPSPFSNILNTVFTTAVIDTCSKSISLFWNSYPSFPKDVTGYSVLLSVDDGTFQEVEAADDGTLNMNFNDFTINSDYCYVVRANLEGGSYSYSNKACVSTSMLKPPDWINADYATVDANNKITLSFSADPASEIMEYRLERKTGSSSFQTVANLFPEANKIMYTDNQADVNQVNTYRLFAINSCNVPVIVSNSCSNIVLSLERAQDDISLSWNSYKDWLGEVSSYKIFIKTGTGFLEKAGVLPPDTTFTLHYQDIMYDVTGSELCFYIEASERSNPHNINGVSNSPVICSAPVELITVPNVFTPNNDLVNDLFSPVLSFTPSGYHLIISDRKGKVLFETKDYFEKWDGSSAGIAIPGGVYLWFLETTTPSGRKISKTGTITIVKKAD